MSARLWECWLSGQPEVFRQALGFGFVGVLRYFARELLLYLVKTGHIATSVVREPFVISCLMPPAKVQPVKP